MDNLRECAIAFSKLLDVKYDLKIAKKAKITELSIVFDKRDFHHLIGLQYLEDLPQLKRDRAKIFNEIIEGKLTYDDINKSSFINKIEKRIKSFLYIEELLDSNDIIFRFNKKVAYSKIEAKYLLVSFNYGDNEVYLFIDKLIKDDELDDRHYCKSFFPKTDIDYKKGQPKYTLLYKEKVYLINGERKVQLDKIKEKI